MGLFNFFGKRIQQSPLEKFEAIVTSVQSHTKFLLNDDFDGLDPEVSASKTLFQVMDKEQRQKMGDEEKNKLDKLDEIKHVLDILEKEMRNGHISEAEGQEIINSKEFKDYNAIN